MFAIDYNLIDLIKIIIKKDFFKYIGENIVQYPQVLINKIVENNVHKLVLKKLEIISSYFAVLDLIDLKGPKLDKSL